MSNFFLSNNVFYSFRKLYPHFVHIFGIISFFFAAEFEELKIGTSGKRLTKRFQFLTTLRKMALKNILGEGESTKNQIFSFFHSFLTFYKQISMFEYHLFCCTQKLSFYTSQNFVVWERIKSLLFESSPMLLTLYLIYQFQILKIQQQTKI